MNGFEAVQLVEEILRRTNPEGQWCPHTPHPKQREFLRLDCLEALFGGAAGPGKSDALLMGALQYVEKPRYAALLLRRTFTDLALPGALMDRAAEWLRPTAAQWNDQRKRWTFPSGSTLSFGFLENDRDKYRYQSSEFQYIGFDELTQFLESQYTYLLSRLRRRSGVDIPLRMRSASNPGGVGHDWVKNRFVTGNSTDCVFVPARLDDNPHVDQNEYRRALSRLDSMTRAQLEEGRWIRDAAGQLYQYKPERNDSEAPSVGEWSYVLGIDLGTSESVPSTAMVVLAFSKYDFAVRAVFASAYSGMTPSSIAEEVVRLRDVYGGFQAIVVDHGGLGLGYIKEFQQRWGLPVKAAEKSNKLGYRKLLNGDFETGRLLVVPKACSPLVQELQELQWNEQGSDCAKGAIDHCTDALLYGWREAKHWLAKEKQAEPERGTKEWMEREEKKLRMSVAARMKAKKETPWWRKSGT